MPNYTYNQTANKHQGRKRSFAHVEGNFPTHVYTNSMYAKVSYFTALHLPDTKLLLTSAVSVPKSCHEHIELQLLAMQKALPGLELFDHGANQVRCSAHDSPSYAEILHVMHI